MVKITRIGILILYYKASFFKNMLVIFLLK